MAEPINAPTEKKARRITQADWSAIAEFVYEEKKRRATDRFDHERKWKEVDRQIAMTPEVMQSDPDWMPSLELPLASETHELLVADGRKLIFPSDREFFSARAALASQKDLANLNWDGFGRGPGPVQEAIAASDPQEFANHLTVGVLQKFHSMYDFRGAVDALNGEAFKYSVFCGHIRWVRQETSTEEFTGSRSKRYPALVPCSMWNTYLDDSPAKMFSEGIHIGPSIIRTYQMHISDLKLAAKKGSTDPTDIEGGWRRSAVAPIEEALSSASGSKNHVKIIRFDGDAVIPRNGSESIYLPNVIIDVVEDGMSVIRYRERDMPFNPYIVGYYHRDDIRSAYGSSPLIKGAPIQKSSTRALMEWLACAALHARPPGTYDPYDPHLQAAGGPKITPGAMLPGNVNPKLMQVGDPGPIMEGLQALLKQYENSSGVTPTRLGQQTKSHQTAFAVDQEVTRGESRTVDYISSNLHGALRSFLYMEYELAKQCGEETVFLPEYGGYVRASGQNLPETVEFDIAGSGTPIDERERRAMKLQSLQALVATAPAAAQMGKPVPDITAIQKDILRLGGIFDVKRYFPDATPGDAAGTGGVPGGAAGGPALPGAVQVLPAQATPAMGAG